MNIPTLVLSIQIWKKIEKVICRHSLKQNIDMRRNKSYTFGGGRGGLDETLRAPNVFIFATEKEHNFQTDENIALLYLKRKKKTCLSSHRYFVVYFLPLQQLFLSSHNAIYSPLRPIYTARLCRMRQAYDRPTTWLKSRKRVVGLIYTKQLVS